MSHPKPCIFFNKVGGCRRGSNCQFAHEKSPQNERGRNALNSTSSANVPPGRCSYFWNTGQCRLGFNCRYHHEKKPPEATTDSDQPLQRHATAPRTASQSNISVNLTPTQVHNQLRRFLDPSFRFEYARSPKFDMYTFVALLGNATSENNWTVEDGQMLLTTIAEPGKTGLLRLGDIIRHPQVGVDAGASVSRISFQKAYIGLIMYFSSDFVVKSTISRDVNSLYSLIHYDFQAFAATVTNCMDKLIANGNFKDLNTLVQPAYLTGNRIFPALSTVLFEYITRFKNAIVQSPDVIPLIRKLDEWLSVWIAGINAEPPAFQDDWASKTSRGSRAFTVRYIKGQVSGLVVIADRTESKAVQSSSGKPSSSVNDPVNVAALAYLEVNFEGPGELRQPGGPRHDNDHEDISDIRIAPTHLELISTQRPYLPSTLVDAPHHLPAGTMERWLDTQFRLLREELIAPLRTALQCVLRDMAMPTDKKTMLSTLINNGGGRYIGGTSGNNKIMFNVYTNCIATKIDFHPHKDVIVDMFLDTPPGSARSAQALSRRRFWEGRGGKRLMQGSLIGLVRGEGASAKAYLGVVSSRSEELVRSSAQTPDKVKIQINFFDSDMLLQILGDLRRIPGGGLGKDTPQLLIESPVLFETIRPFLEALRREPTLIPLSQYLIPATSLREITVDPPKYSISPEFTYDLGCLFKQQPPQPVLLRVDDQVSVTACRESLQSDNSRLDPSQANALIDSLSREVSLIQGPPGTGKTYIGVELLRVLKANNVGPILMIAFTNHALDHMLSAVIDSGITKRIVRLGSRSADERISQFNLETLEMAQGRTNQDRSFTQQFHLLKQNQEALEHLLTGITRQDVESVKLEEYLCNSYPDHYDSLCAPPIWVDQLRSRVAPSGSDSEWKVVGSKSENDNSRFFGFWDEGKDLAFLQARRAFVHEKSHGSPPPKLSENRFAILEKTAKDKDDDTTQDEEVDLASLVSRMNLGLAALWYQTWDLKNNDPQAEQETPQQEDQPANQPEIDIIDEDILENEITDVDIGIDNLPEIPQTDRPLEDLLSLPISMWSLSRSERRKLRVYWTRLAREAMVEEERDEFDRLRKVYQERRTHYNELKDQLKLRLLKDIDLVGCTTTGAAKFSALLKSFSPKVLVVEEAGQVLEAHVLGSLVPSVEHLILIGDPLQLRPSLANYSLSDDSKEGKLLYRFDVSLMERLSTNGLPMSQLEIQRRMRPSISNLIKQTLYPSLQDHPLTTEYPAVRGMSKNVFFMSHEHRETGGGEDSVSKHNAFEVEMIVALVLYFLRQGCYSEDGDIVVLCAYLGQLVRMRDALAGKVITMIDERDQELIAAHDDGEERDDPIAVERVAVNKKVLLRTVDNFQGEEAKIVILSLVRNSGSDDEHEASLPGTLHSSIGFLKSKNRTNVAISRAQHGLYIMGNARDLAEKSPMWATVIDTLDLEGCVGNGFPIQCSKHPQERNLITKPHELHQWAPDGGCLQSCKEPLRCGHVCPYKCHSDDENHISVSCLQKCLRQCPNGHPCNKLCWERCGVCVYPIVNVCLPCGHFASVPCYLTDDLAKFSCQELVEKSFTNCEHKKFVECSQSIDVFRCTKPCNTYLKCCGRKCEFECGQCQGVNEQTDSDTPRVSHCSHPCRRTLFCGHPCKVPCSENHECTQRCEQRCQRRCEHASCTKACHLVCAPCAEPCTWSCPHRGTCPLPCGSICSRLPCDQRCTRILVCGHRCPSLCGEPCAICITCASDERKADVVDLVMGTTLGEIEVGYSLDTLLLTLSCGHTFTVETLDGTCEMSSFYTQTADGRWSGINDRSGEPGFMKAPACPTCRSPITIPRYGRAFKRSILDTAELNVASDMSRSLSRLQNGLLTFNAEDMPSEEGIKNAFRSYTLTDDVKGRILNGQVAQLHRSNRGKIAARFFALDRKNVFMIPKKIGDVWRSKTGALLKDYEGCISTAQQRPAHITAYENGLSKLYQLELEAFAKSENGGPQYPEENAMRIARLKVGRPPPRADKRFCVEALWLSVKIRFKLAEYAEKLLSLIVQSDSQPGIFVWASFIRFIYVSCVQDIELALEIAQSSESYRQIVSSNLLKIRANFQLFCFDVGMWRLQPHSTAERQELAKVTVKGRREARGTIISVGRDYISRAEGETDREWLRDDFIDPSRKILEHWEELENSLLRDTFYQPVSLDELTQVVRAFDFTYIGHWYTCENGHIYAIGECGGAMEQASCPECRAPIGGMNHDLNSSNRRAAELEEIARREGAQESQFPWGR